MDDVCFNAVIPPSGGDAEFLDQRLYGRDNALGLSDVNQRAVIDGATAAAAAAAAAAATTTAAATEEEEEKEEEEEEEEEETGHEAPGTLVSVEVDSSGECKKSDFSTAEEHPEMALSEIVHHPQNGSSCNNMPCMELEQGKKCSDASQAVRILKDINKLSDVTIRKNTMTWSCWNIADVVRSPNKDALLWKGGSLPRKLNFDPNRLEELISEEAIEDKAFRQQMEELCRNIDQKDHELHLLLDQILRIARGNAVGAIEKPTAFRADLIENETPQPDLGSISQTATDAPTDNRSKPEKAKSKEGNLFSRLLRGFRRLLNRGNRSLPK